MSKRITVSLSRELVNHLTINIAKELKDSELELAKVVHKIWVGKLNEKVLKAFADKDIEGYFRCNSTIYLEGEGFDYERIHLLGGLKVPNTGGNCVIIPTKKEAERIKPFFDEVRDKRGNLKDLRSKLYVAIRSLMSYKKIIDAFPETKDFLEEQTPKQTLPAINYSDLRSQLK